MDVDGPIVKNGRERFRVGQRGDGSGAMVDVLEANELARRSEATDVGVHVLPPAAARADGGGQPHAELLRSREARGGRVAQSGRGGSRPF